MDGEQEKYEQFKRDAEAMMALVILAAPAMYNEKPVVMFMHGIWFACADGPLRWDRDIGKQEEVLEYKVRHGWSEKSAEDAMNNELRRVRDLLLGMATERETRAREIRDGLAAITKGREHVARALGGQERVGFVIDEAEFGTKHVVSGIDLGEKPSRSS